MRSSRFVVASNAVVISLGVRDLSTKKLTHQYSSTHLNSMYHIGINSFNKRVVVDSNMQQFASDIDCFTLNDDQWHVIYGVTTFQHKSHQIMQNLITYHKPTLDLLPLFIAHLVKHCKTNKVQLLDSIPKLQQSKCKIRLKNMKNRKCQNPPQLHSTSTKRYQKHLNLCN